MRGAAEIVACERVLTICDDDLADITSNAKDQLRERLERVIVHTIRKFPALRYFQGYHDVSIIGRAESQSCPS